MDPQPIQSLLSSKQQEDVGIECYISKTTYQIKAITKYLLTDFIVNQITVDGQVLKLDKKPTYEKNNNWKEKKQKKQKKEKDLSIFQITPQVHQLMVQHLGKQTTQAIAELYKKLSQGQKIPQWQFTIPNPPESKQQRTNLHKFIRQHTPNLESSFSPDPPTFSLSLSHSPSRQPQSQNRNKYTHFILYKSNIDTMSALFKLSKIIGVSQKLFSTAGLKDKRGCTCQLVSIFNVDKGKMEKFYEAAWRNKEIWIDGIKEGMVDGVGVGDLWGNQFGLILRLVPEGIQKGIEDKIKERVQSLRENGMINYFGMQRFGSCATKTHMIGLKILKKQWKSIVQQLILEDTKNGQINNLKRQCYQNQQYARAQKFLPNKYKIQKNLFRGLKKFGRNYQNVFESMPRSIRTLYPHSLQSYLWNRMVSRRIKQYGIQVQIGDLVGKKVTGLKKLMNQVQQQKIEPQNPDSQPDQELSQQALQQKYQVQLVTSPSSHCPTDIVLPLYGSMIVLPPQSLAYKYLQDEFKMLGIDEKYFGENSKKLCFKGMYRKMIVKPENVKYRIRRYENGKEELLSGFYTIGEEVGKEGNGGKMAVQLIMQLPKSSYATMAIREILHIPSSFEAQMLLNKLYDDKKQQKVEQTIKGIQKQPQNEHQQKKC